MHFIAAYEKTEIEIADHLIGFEKITLNSKSKAKTRFSTLINLNIQNSTNKNILKSINIFIGCFIFLLK